MACILVVEDDLGIALLLQEVLSEAGHEVRLATDGRQAMSTLGKERPPDLVLTDLNLPYVRGAELIGMMRRDPKMRAIPVVVATGASVEELPPQETYQMLIQKPYEMTEVVKAVRALLCCPAGAVSRPVRGVVRGGAASS
ncbi:MAG: response regulator [Limnochordia bacterium]